MTSGYHAGKEGHIVSHETGGNTTLEQSNGARITTGAHLLEPTGKPSKAIPPPRNQPHMTPADVKPGAKVRLPGGKTGEITALASKHGEPGAWVKYFGETDREGYAAHWVPLTGLAPARTGVSEHRAEKSAAGVEGTERLHEYWVHGAGAAKIGWGTPGDFDRCVTELSKYIDRPEGYCNLAHHAALGIYPATHAKELEGRNIGMGAETRAAMSSADQNDLPDSAFAFIEPGGSKDSEGKTTPRSLRHFPIHDAAHVRNALSRAPQSPFGDKAMPKIKAAAEKLGVHVGDESDDRSVPREQEWRFTPGVVEVRSLSDGKKRIGGYGAVFGKLSRNLGGFVEKVSPTAFNQSRQLGWPGVVCRLNHDRNQLLGTSESRTLSLRLDNIGLDYEVEPPPSQSVVYELVQRGDIRHSSFAFHCPPGGDEWRTTDQNYPLRILHEVQLLDVAPVTEDEAYTDATVGLRSLASAFDAPFEEVRSLAASDDLRQFFVRTDRGIPAPQPLISGPQAMMRLMDKKFGPSGRA